MASSPLPSLTVGYVPGVTPAKWARSWAQRHPEVPLQLLAVAAAEAADVVRTGSVDAAVLRPPADASGLAVIPLYEEITVVVVPTDHLLSAVDAVTVTDLDERTGADPARRRRRLGRCARVFRSDHRPENVGEAIRTRRCRDRAR